MDENIRTLRNLFSSYSLRGAFEPEVGKKLAKVLEDSYSARQYFVENVDNHLFRRIVNDLGLPPAYAKRREELERNVIRNPRSHSLSCVKEALCDILFHENKKNVMLIFETIAERAKFDPEFERENKKFLDAYEKVKEFLTLEEGKFSEEELEEKIFVALKECQNVDMPKAMQDMFEQAKNSFYQDVSSHLDDSRKMFDGIEPDTIKTENGEVKVFKMQNQTKNQSCFQILARTSYPTFFDDVTSTKDYARKVSKFAYSSFSIFDQSKASGFSGEYRVILGFSSLGSGELLSANTHDGQTNQYHIHRGKYVMRQEYLPTEEFLRNTGSYNEVVVTNPETIIPTMVISPTEVPSEQTIRVATALNLPIVYIDEKAYPQYPEVQKELGDKVWYSYEEFLPEPLTENPENKNILLP